MTRPSLGAKDRQQMEPLLEDFERQVRLCHNGALPDKEAFLAEAAPRFRAYLEHEMNEILRDAVRGKYVILDQIESGGMGMVCRARHIELGKVFALKEVRSEVVAGAEHDELHRRFQRERLDVCRRLENHPNIVSFTDTGVTDDGVPYLVMDYVDGEDLGKIVQSVGPLPASDCAQIIHDAAVGLAHAHDRGLIHRDIKPSNLMISRYGVVKVLDFGLAKLVTQDHQLTALTAGQVMGTFDYMSPEQCQERTPDTRSDIYSLGCTLYFLLAGKAPYASVKSQFDKMNSHIHSPVPPIDTTGGQGPLWLIIQKMTKKSPADRYGNMLEVAQALRPLTNGSDLLDLATAKRNTPQESPETVVMPDEEPALDDGRPRKTARKSHDHTQVGVAKPILIKRRKWMAGVAVGCAALGMGVVWSLSPSSNSRVRTVVNVLPGLNGRWWFEEKPWLLPEVRLHLGASLAEQAPDGGEQFIQTLHESDVVGVYAHLLNACNSLRFSWPKQTQDRLWNFEELDPEIIEHEQLLVPLSDLAASLDEKSEKELSATDVHLRAILHHYLKEYDQANAAYDRAISLYPPEQQSLKALCRMDLGVSLHEQKRWTSAAASFNRSRAELQHYLGPDGATPDLFALYSLCMEADAYRRVNNHASAIRCQQQAERIVASLPPGHPLTAFFHERRAWRLLDTWQLEAAEEDFTAALEIRLADEAANLRAKHFIYWDEQGLAMAQLYSGNAAAARDKLQGLLTAIAGASRLSAKQRHELEDRQPNLHERLADTALFADAQNVDAPRELDRAVSRAVDLGFKQDSRDVHLVRLEYKSVCAYLLAGKSEQAQSRLNEADNLRNELFPEENGNASRNAPKYAMTRTIALALNRWLGQGEDGVEELIDVLSKPQGELVRDDLLLLLRVGEEVLKASTVSDENKARVAQEMIRLIESQPFGAASQAVQRSGVPGIFQSYLDLAMSRSH